MFKKVLRSCMTQLKLWLGVAPVLFSAGCSVPSMNVVPGLPAAPTVPQLQTHVACVLARAMNERIGPAINNDPKKRDENFRLWRMLIDYNFLSTINLTLFVTQAQGLNPSLNFITPLTNLGKPIDKIVETSNGITKPDNVTANSFNFTLAVGFQLNGIQDHNFVLNYVIDMHRLYNQMYKTETDGTISILPANQQGLLARCDAEDKLGDPNSIQHGMKGDLALAETIQTGLEALDRAQYSPVTAGSGGKSGQTTPSVSQTAGSTAFSSKIDFSLTWGVNGGPGWNLLKFKGPQGGIAPGGQLVNYSRQKTDALISTFSPTCKADALVSFNDPAAFLKPWTRVVSTAANQKFSSFEVDAFRRRAPFITTDQPVPGTQELITGNDRAREFAQSTGLFMISIAIPKDETELPYTPVNGIQGTIVINQAPESLTAKSLPLQNSAVTWTGFFNKADKSYSLRGSIADVQAGSFLGYVYVDLRPDGTGGYLSDVRFSVNAVDALLSQTDPGPRDYWQSLPFCSNSGPFLSNGLNFLQQIPPSVASTLLQQ